MPKAVLSSKDSQLLFQGGHGLVGEMGRSLQNRIRKLRVAGEPSEAPKPEASRMRSH